MVKVKSILKVLVIPAGFILGGCTAKNEEVSLIKMKPCEVYNKAVDSFNEKSYLMTNQQLDALDENFPFSEVMDKSLFLAGKSYFLNDKFMEAVERFKRFLKLYPKHERAPEAEYMLSMSYWYMSGTVSRDITFLNIAKKSMKKFVNKYPENENTERFKKKIKAIDNSLAKKEVDTAVYFLDDHDHSAAISRLQVVLTQYKHTDLVPEALYRMVEAYTSIQLMEEAEFYKEKLKKDFPESEWNKEVVKWYKKIDEIQSRKIKG
ncbi:MAG: outer membrane protein assembly factor BamD [Alphaproteobacteria bacterium]|jgi:outer membrane protein assembly factor BamD|nr:outer membrane protein assembly factor BamD [Alphaproteobacteria bacterium]